MSAQAQLHPSRPPSPSTPAVAASLRPPSTGDSAALQDAPVLPFKFDLLAQIALTRASAASAAVSAKHLSGALKCVASCGPSAPPVGTALKNPHSVPGLCLATGRTQLCRDALADPRVNRDVCTQRGIRSMAVVPIRYDGRVLGLLAVYSPQKDQFGPREIQALEQLITESLQPADLDDEFLPPAQPDSVGTQPTQTQPADTQAASPQITTADAVLTADQGVGQTTIPEAPLFAAIEIGGAPRFSPRVLRIMLIAAVLAGACFLLLRLVKSGPASHAVAAGRAAPMEDPTLVRDVSLQKAPGALRINIALDRHVYYQSGRLDDPRCIYFDLYESRLTPQAPLHLPVRDSKLVSGIDVMEQPGRVVRVIVNLRSGADYTLQFTPDPPRLQATIR